MTTPDTPRPNKKRNGRLIALTCLALLLAGGIGWLSLSPNHPLPPISSVTLKPGDTFPNTLTTAHEALVYDGMAGENLIRVHTGKRDARQTSTVTLPPSMSKGADMQGDASSNETNTLKLPNTRSGIIVRVESFDEKTERLTLRYLRLPKVGR